MAPRKIRLVAGLVRGKSVVDAETQLLYMQKAAAGIVLKTLKSAIANAVDQYDASPEALLIDRIMVNAGSTLKRWRPRAFGRAAPIHKRSAHITIALQSTKPLQRKEREKLVAVQATHEETRVLTHAHESADAHGVHDEAGHTPAVSDPRKVGSRHEPSRKGPEGKKSKGFLKKIFSRKTG